MRYRTVSSCVESARFGAIVVVESLMVVIGGYVRMIIVQYCSSSLASGIGTTNIQSSGRRFVRSELLKEFR